MLVRVLVSPGRLGSGISDRLSPAAPRSAEEAEAHPGRLAGRPQDPGIPAPGRDAASRLEAGEARRPLAATCGEERVGPGISRTRLLPGVAPADGGEASRHPRVSERREDLLLVGGFRGGFCTEGTLAAG